MTYAVVSDVAEELGRPISSLTSDETAQINRWLRRAEAVIRGRLPGLDDLVTAGALTAEVVADVEAAAVARKVLNPEGKVAERIDDYDYRLNENSRRGEVFITDEEWALLTPVSVSVAFSTRPGFEPDGVA